MAGHSVWREEDESLIRDYEFKDFAAAMAFVNQVADAAEEANHHPDILVHGWNKVRLTLTTHSEGKLTENDRAMAARIDAILGTSP
ncbi:4a-hydroxytetrahydrobiopterin dehydratase [Solirubrobacter soli]|uniref:4a-hydroxytetrahydrobiopterin dehydratase n=1 Tax=Solirubrobacter soli TaxID=363832 RepID=UPI00042057CD|nr:4a-hydroxytetrahydrobiopterin dehydratase [Solirubrobacter soli]